MVVKFLFGSEQSDSSDDEDNVNDDSDMQHRTWTKVRAKQPHFPFGGEPGPNELVILERSHLQNHYFAETTKN
jgi:hypothetical protein